MPVAAQSQREPAGPHHNVSHFHHLFPKPPGCTLSHTAQGIVGNAGSYSAQYAQEQNYMIQEINHMSPVSTHSNDNQGPFFSTNSPPILNLSPNLSPAEPQRGSPVYDLRESTRRRSVQDMYNNQHSPQYYSGVITEDSGRKSESPTRKRRKVAAHQTIIDLTNSPSPPPVRAWETVNEQRNTRRRSTTQRRISGDRCNTPRSRGSPGTRRRPRERNPARHTDSPERRAFQPPHVPPPRHVHPANIPQQHGHPLMMDMEQMQATAPVTVPPYAIPVCSAPHHIPVCTTTHLPGCHTSQPAWSIPACGMHIPTHCGMQHLPNCNLASIPMTHSIPPMIHHPPPHPAMTHHHHMTMPSPLLHSPSTLQHQDDDVQIIAEHRAPHTIQMPNTLHHGPTLAHHTAPVILHEPPLHAPPHELYGPYPRYTRRPAGRSRWRSIPPPPPPYPGFLLHFLAMLGNPPVPGSYGMDLRDEGREVENYEALLNLAERLGEAKPRGLTKSDIDQLPSYRFNVDTHRNDADQTCCVVCMCDFEARQLLRVLPCSHEFHAKCVDKWLKTNRTCPICRADASEVSSSPQPQ
ncbi:E3 ubiquitin-protein ligase RNF38-like isoform X2 [Tubulanus polymorphus]|uniref:E3 ubiquitin-protein ligase RNF38-like isoform X2 n=1 Tax=Tubulanus polymorphus TaxID=672921 RepID=UPI003DA65C9C